MFIIDFDDTLMDTQAYKEERMTALEKMGIARAQYLQIYKEVYYSYNHENHAAALARLGFDRGKVLRALDGCLKNVGQYLFQDAKIFLEFLQSRRQPIILLSFGVKEIQEFKLRATGLDGFFDKVYTTVRPKEEIMREILNGNARQAWFINDKVAESVKIKKLFPNLIVVLKHCRAYPEGDYKNCGLPYFDTLMEIKEYIAQYV